MMNCHVLFIAYASSDLLNFWPYHGVFEVDSASLDPREPISECFKIRPTAPFRDIVKMAHFSLFGTFQAGFQLKQCQKR